MRTTHWLGTAILALLLTSCAGIGSVPTPQAREALAPTGKLRVGLQLGNPLNVIRDPASGEMKGVAFDLGNGLARRLGVPFESVLYDSVGALLDGGKSGAWDVAFVGFSPARAKEWDFSALHLEVEFGYLVPENSYLDRRRCGSARNAGCSAGEVRPGCVFFTHAEKYRDGPRTKQRWRVGGVEIGEG